MGPECNLSKDEQQSISKGETEEKEKRIIDSPFSTILNKQLTCFQFFLIALAL